MESSSVHEILRGDVGGERGDRPSGVRRLHAAFSGPNPREAILAWLKRFYDPEAEWDFDPTVVIEQQIYRGIDEVITFFDQVLEAFEQVRQVPERHIDCGDQVLTFVRTEARGRVAGLDIDEEWTHLLTLRDGKIVRLQQFRERTDALKAAGLAG